MALLLTTLTGIRFSFGRIFCALDAGRCVVRLDGFDLNLVVVEVVGVLWTTGFLLVVDNSTESATTALSGEIDSPVLPKIAGKIELHDCDVSGVSNFDGFNLCVAFDLFSISLFSTFCTLLTIFRMLASESSAPLGFLAITCWSLSPLATMLWISFIVISRFTRSPSSLNV